MNTGGLVLPDAPVAASVWLAMMLSTRALQAVRSNSGPESAAASLL
jgi:hypothetical protein